MISFHKLYCIKNSKVYQFDHFGALFYSITTAFNRWGTLGSQNQLKKTIYEKKKGSAQNPAFSAGLSFSLLANTHSFAVLTITTSLTLMLLEANLANTKWCKNTEIWLKPWQMVTHLRVLSESNPMNTNMTRFRYVCFCILNKHSLSIRRVNPSHYVYMST